MIRFLKSQWFLIGLTVVVVVGFVFCRQLQAFSNWSFLRNLVLFTVLFLMSLPVKTSELGKVLLSPWASLFAVIVNFACIPLMAWGSSFWFETFIGEGLIVASAVPCTLASAAVWTRRAGGNDSVAIFVTLFTNFFCFALTPFWIWLTLGEVAEISTYDLVRKLTFLVVLPICLAQGLRQFRRFGDWSTRRKIELGIIAQSGILLMVLVGSIRMGLKVAESPDSFSWVAIGQLLIAVNTIHLAALFFGRWAAAGLGFCREDQIAIGIAGSQKTLMVGLNTAVELNRSILPMLLFHICQLFVDTIIADRWRKETIDIEAGHESDDDK